MFADQFHGYINDSLFYYIVVFVSTPTSIPLLIYLSSYQTMKCNTLYCCWNV